MEDLLISEIYDEQGLLRKGFFITIEGEDDFGNKAVRRVNIPRPLAHYIWKLQQENRQLREDRKKEAIKQIGAPILETPPAGLPRRDGPQ